MKRTLLVFAIALASANSWATDPAIDPTLPCLAGVSKDPEFSNLGTKIVMSVGAQPSMAMLADNSRPTKAEKVLLGKAEVRAEQCFALGVDYRRQNYGDAVSSIMEQSIYAFKELGAQLYSGKISYGDFNKQRWQSDQYYNQQIAAVSQQQATQQQAIDLQNRREAAAERAQREAVQEAHDALEAQERESRRQAGIQQMQAGMHLFCASNHLNC